MAARGFAQNTVIVTARLVSGTLLNFIVAAFIARRLDPEGNGTYSLIILTALTGASIASLGMGPSTVYHIGAGLASVRAVLRRNICHSASVALLCGISASIIHWHWSGQMLVGISSDHLAFALMLVAPIILYGSVVSVYQGLRDFTRYAWISLIPSVINAFCLGGIWLIGHVDVISAVCAFGAGYATALGIALWHLQDQTRVPVSVERQVSLFVMLSYGLKAHVGNVVTLLNYRLNVYILGIFAAADTLGVYVVSILCAESIWLLSNAVGPVVFSTSASLRGDRMTNCTQVSQASRLTAMATVLCAVVLLAVGRPAIRLAFGEEYVNAYTAMALLLPGIVCWSVVRVLANDLAGRGWPSTNSAISFATLVINTGLNMWLIPSYFAYGAAIATSVSYVVGTILTLVVYCHITGVSPAALLVPRIDDLKDVIRVMRTFRTKGD